MAEEMEAAGAPPSDLRVVYEWREGSIPPPDFYSLRIELGPGTHGELALTPDYPTEAPPTFKQAFAVAPETLSGLYARMAAAGGFTRDWREADADAQEGRFGGELEWMTVHADGRTIGVPDIPADATARPHLEEIYAAIRAAVPEKVRRALMRKRKRYHLQRGRSPL